MQYLLKTTLRACALTCVSAGIALSAASSMKTPYLVGSGTPGKVSLAFQTSEAPGSVSLSWGMSPTALDSSTSSRTQTHSDHVYSMDMEGLQPGQHYFYKITVDGRTETGSFVAPQNFVGTGAFQAVQNLASTSDLTFYAYGDTRSYNDDHAAV